MIEKKMCTLGVDGDAMIGGGNWDEIERAERRHTKGKITTSNPDGGEARGSMGRRQGREAASEPS